MNGFRNESEGHVGPGNRSIIASVEVSVYHHLSGRHRLPIPIKNWLHVSTPPLDGIVRPLPPIPEPAVVPPAPANTPEHTECMEEPENYHTDIDAGGGEWPDDDSEYYSASEEPENYNTAIDVGGYGWPDVTGADNGKENGVSASQGGTESRAPAPGSVCYESTLTAATEYVIRNRDGTVFHPGNESLPIQQGDGAGDQPAMSALEEGEPGPAIEETAAPTEAFVQEAEWAPAPIEPLDTGIVPASPTSSGPSVTWEGNWDGSGDTAGQSSYNDVDDGLRTAWYSSEEEEEVRPDESASQVQESGW